MSESELNIRLKSEDIVKLNQVISWMNVYKPHELGSYSGGGIARKIISSLIDAELNRLIAENIKYKNLEKELKKVKKESADRRGKIKELKAELEASQATS